MLSTNSVQCPRSLLDRAAKNAATLTAVVNADSMLTMQSVQLATQQGLIEPILVGEPGMIKSIARELAWDISGIPIKAAPDEFAAAEISVALAKNNEAHALMKGDVHTNVLLKAVLNEKNGIRSKKRLSHVFHMSVPHSQQTLCITDAVVNVQPDINTKLHIARNATELLHALGHDLPKIAVLSATEVATSSMPSSVEANEVVRIATNGEINDALIDGPFAFDNAVSPHAAQLKGVSGPVAGHADCLLVPNIETGNALFKQMVYFMSAAAAGVVLGAQVPITLTSRADPAAARLASTALASIYAAYVRQ